MKVETSHGIPFVEFGLPAVLAELHPYSVYATRVKELVVQLLAGEIASFAFNDGMFRAIRVGITAAWEEGALKAGIQPDELSPGEQRAMQNEINGQLQHVLRLMSDILVLRERIALKTRDYDSVKARLLDRATLWANRYYEVVAKATALVGKDQKLRWTIDPFKKNCSSCLKLNGKVKRASWWVANGILPRVAGAPYLMCRGFLCGCSLEPTDEPMTRGRMPSLP